jgi:hypothetical protein
MTEALPYWSVVRNLFRRGFGGWRVCADFTGD